MLHNCIYPNRPEANSFISSSSTSSLSKHSLKRCSKRK